ncbi:MAG: biotin transporter BioY [Lachnospiraceae bacterium]|nr:biotin transporter BioY [Lachnospiraceae bacterium]
MNNKAKITTITITRVALATAVICVLGPLALPLPISPVPISLGILGVFFSVYVNGWLWGSLSCILYLLIGLVGVPVFSGFSGGAGKLLGPTGGYMIGYILLALIAGFFIEKFEKQIPLHIVGMVLGTAACYLLGTIWLAISTKMNFQAALLAGVIPFIPADIVKMVIAILVGIPVRRGIKKISAIDESRQKKQAN